MSHGTVLLINNLHLISALQSYINSDKTTHLYMTISYIDNL